MDRRGFLKVILAGAVAVVVPIGFTGTTAEALESHVDLPVVDGYAVCFNSRTLKYTGEPGNYTMPELFHFLARDQPYECVGFVDPRVEMQEGL